MTATSGRPAYAVGYLRDVAPVPQVAEYIERIEATMAPFGGEWLVHGCSLVPLEGTWTGALVVIRFPSLEAARQWWDSPAYRELAPLRTDHSDSMVCLVEGVPQGYLAATTAAALRSQLAVAT